MDGPRQVGAHYGKALETFNVRDHLVRTSDVPTGQVRDPPTRCAVTHVFPSVVTIQRSAYVVTICIVNGTL